MTTTKFAIYNKTEKCLVSVNDCLSTFDDDIALTIDGLVIADARNDLLNSNFYDDLDADQSYEIVEIEITIKW